MDSRQKQKLARQIREQIDTECRNIAELERLSSMDNEDKSHQSQSDSGSVAATDNGSVSNLLERVNRLRRVLDKIDSDDFGTCEVCGEDIPFERLLIVPDTSLCVRHAEARESG